MTAVDVFCGAGGLTHGLIDGGVRVVVGYDVDPDCEYPYTANNKADFRLVDVWQLSPDELQKQFGSKGPRVLAGCAPCQAFSTYTQGRRHSARWRLLDRFTDLAVAVRPDIVTMENVPPLQSHRRFREFVQRLIESGYTVAHRIVQCADYGAPQSRSRLVLLASLHGLPRLLDPLEFGASARTVRDAIADLPPLRAGEFDSHDRLHRACALTQINLNRIRASRPGGTWREWPRDLRLPCHLRHTGKSYPSIYGRMEWDRPAPTITTLAYNLGSGRFGHPEQDRAISLREAALLQTFPRGYKFVPATGEVHIRSIGRLIGNAVPILLGRLIGRSIIMHLEGVRA